MTQPQRSKSEGDDFQMITLSRGPDRQVKVMRTASGWHLYGDDVEPRDLTDAEVVQVVRDWLIEGTFGAP